MAGDRYHCINESINIFHEITCQDLSLQKCDLFRSFSSQFDSYSVGDVNALCILPNSTLKNLSMKVLYHSETWDLMARRWAKLEKDFLPKTGKFDISKVIIYDKRPT